MWAANRKSEIDNRRWRRAGGSVLVGLVLGLGLVIATTTPASAAASAGFAEIEITPQVGIDLGGRGCSNEASTAVLDPLFAQATVLQDGAGGRLVLVSLDLIGISRAFGDRLRAEIAERVGTSAEMVLINCSHTHSGPMMVREAFAACSEAKPQERKYYDELARRIVTLCANASERAMPCTVHVHESRSDVGINRRGRSNSGETVMRPNPDAPYEPRVWILRIAGADGKPIGVIFSYACHPVIVYGHARTAISGEYPAAARRFMRERLGEGVHVQFLQGAAGNVRPRITADLERLSFKKTRPEDHLTAGRQLAEAVLHGLGAEEQPLELALAARMERIELRRGSPPARSVYASAASKPGDAWPAPSAREWLERLARGERLPEKTSWTAGAVRLAPRVWILYLSGEPVVQWADMIRSWLPGRDVLTLGYTQEVSGYLPTDEILPEGGYEVAQSNYYRAETPAPFAAGLDEAVRESVLKQVRRIEAGANRLR